MCTLGEIEDALSVLAFGYQTGLDRPVNANSFKDAYCDPAAREQLSKLVTLLHCTSQYPTEYENVNLRAMQTMAKSFGLPVGYSDHTMGIAISCAAVAMGATMLEKHFTLDRSFKGPDHRMSLEPGELKALVQAVREIEVALGSPFKYPTPGEIALKPLVRKGLFAVVPIKEGEAFTSENLASKRPEGPVSAANYWNVLGKRASRSYDEDEALTEVSGVQ
jgi:N-acetylneuraminate synthase